MRRNVLLFQRTPQPEAKTLSERTSFSGLGTLSENQQALKTDWIPNKKIEANFVKIDQNIRVFWILIFIWNSKHFES